jgi:hypothetical protein
MEGEPLPPPGIPLLCDCVTVSNMHGFCYDGMREAPPPDSKNPYPVQIGLYDCQLPELKFLKILWGLGTEEE